MYTYINAVELTNITQKKSNIMETKKILYNVPTSIL